MKKTIIAVIMLMPVIALGQKKYVLTGQIAPDSSDMVYLRYNTLSGLKTDSSKITAGKFRLSAPINSIMEGHLFVQKKDKVNSHRKIYLEPLEMKLSAPTSSLDDAVITGSPANNDYQLLVNALKPVTEKSEALMRRWRATANKMDTVFRRKFSADQTEIELETRKIKKQFASTHHDSFVGLVAYLESGSMDLQNNFEGSVENFNKFSPSVRASNMGKGLQEQIDGMIKTKIGLTAMDFMQKDTNGKPVRLSDFRGKYVLLDFWASWCGPCRQETPELVKAYHQYHDKNFTILSVSLDKPSDKKAWLKAIEKDGMVWNNVSDLNYWRNQAAVLYGIKTVPANFLIDPSGKIIAKNLRGEQVIEKLAELIN